jgi:hypothetical protein
MGTSLSAIACVTLWALLLGLVLLVPIFTESATLGDDFIRGTVRVALLFWCLATILMLLKLQSQLARWCWTLACLAYLVHLGMAFHFYHHWSHTHAVAHTEEVSGFGPGIAFSHLFTLAWCADVLTWWLAPRWREGRIPWIDWGLYGYMACIIFCGTVVYEQGFIRWAGLGMFALLGGVFLLRNLAKRHQVCGKRISEKVPEET